MMTNNFCWNCHFGQQPLWFLGNGTVSSQCDFWEMWHLLWRVTSWQHMEFIPGTSPSVSHTNWLSCWPLFANCIVLVLEKWLTAGMGCGCPEGLMHFVLISVGKWALFRLTRCDLALCLSTSSVLLYGTTWHVRAYKGSVSWVQFFWVVFHRFKTVFADFGGTPEKSLLFWE